MDAYYICMIDKCEAHYNLIYCFEMRKEDLSMYSSNWLIYIEEVTEKRFLYCILVGDTEGLRLG